MLQGQGHDHPLQQIGSALQDLWLHSEAVLGPTGTGEAGLPGDSWRRRNRGPGWLMRQWNWLLMVNICRSKFSSMILLWFQYISMVIFHSLAGPREKTCRQKWRVSSRRPILEEIDGKPSHWLSLMMIPRILKVPIGWRADFSSLFAINRGIYIIYIYGYTFQPKIDLFWQ